MLRFPRRYTLGVVRIEGENAVLKSDSVLYPTYDNSTSAISPSARNHMVAYNTIGSGNWEKALQTITWKVDANALPGDGWYKLGIKARQEEMRGFYSNRRISVDGSVPSEEFDQVKFYYDTDFRMTVQNRDSEAVCLHLTAGKTIPSPWRRFPARSATPCDSWMPSCWI